MNNTNNILDEIDSQAAKRVGERIRSIRKDRHLSQSELGQLVGMSADRIQKYENGARKPKNELLSKIAQALDVSPLALTDPNIATPEGVMHAFFEMIGLYDINIRKEPNNAGYRLTIKDSEKSHQLNDYLNNWCAFQNDIDNKLSALPSYNDARTDNEKNNFLTKTREIISEYQNYQYQFPREYNNQNSTPTHNMSLDEQIKQLSSLYKK